MFQFQLAIEARAFMLLFSLLALKYTAKNEVFLIQCSITIFFGLSFENRNILMQRDTKIVCCLEFKKEFSTSTH